MNKKRIWLVIPTALFPYFLLWVLAVFFFSTELPLFEFIMERIFDGNALYFVAVLLLFAVLAVTMSILCFVISIRNRWNSLSLAKTAMIVKLCQVPAYVMIFILGVFLAMAIFTIPFSFGLFLFDCLFLMLTGLLTISGVINAIRQQVFTLKGSIWIIILQLVFCADVVASIVFYFVLKKRIVNDKTELP